MNSHLMKHNIGKSSLSWAMFLAMLFVGIETGVAQIRAGRPMIVRGGVVLDAADGAIPGGQADRDFVDDLSGGASLKTDPDLESILKKAEQYRKDGNWRIATRLWQAVLERGGDALYTEDKQMYFSMTRKVESVIGKLPKDGLDMYRLSADAAATEVLAKAKGPNDTEALSKVVKQFFMSSQGDDAAFRLGCIYLDRHDFVGAIRVFEKIIRDYPDPSVSAEQIQMRLAVAYAYTGNILNATKALDAAKSAAGGTNTAALAQIESVIQNAEVMVAKSFGDGQWSMRHGGPLRYGVMPSLPTDYLKEDLKIKWQFKIEPDKLYDENNYLGKVFLGSELDSDEAKDGTQKEKNLWRRWALNGWRPAGELILVDGKVIFKTGADLATWDANADSPEPLWRPSLLNRFELDDATKALKQMQNMYGGRRAVPGIENDMTEEEIQFFGDKIHQSISVNRGVVYSIEGEAYDWNRAPRVRGNTTRGVQWGVVPRRTRSNCLAAYDLNTGKYLWRVPQLAQFKNEQTTGQKNDESKETPFLEDGGFMSAPLSFETLLLVPVNQGGTIWIYALDALDQGKTVWKSYLCDEPSSGSDPWTPVVMSLDGSDLYVTCGTGVLFALDPVTGGVRFALRYQRQGKLDATMARFGNETERLLTSGWAEDMVLPYGNWLILLGSDREEILAVDRSSGEMVWKCKFKPTIGHKVDYLIGIHEGYLYCGGTNTVCAIHLEGEGRWVWGGFGDEFGGDQSYGRGFLTSEAMYVPVKDSILKLDLKTGKELGRVGVSLPESSPVGNIYSDGRRIWIHNANRLYALMTPEEALAGNTDDTGNPAD
jgi:outer membrane protein assembly factor BamB/TolA-binding protein